MTADQKTEQIRALITQAQDVHDACDITLLASVTQASTKLSDITRSLMKLGPTADQPNAVQLVRGIYAKLKDRVMAAAQKNPPATADSG